MERYKFHKITQFDFESIQQFVVSLKKQVVKCDYGEFETTMLREQFVLELFDDGVRKRLLSEDKLTFDRAVELSSIVEQVGSNEYQFLSSESHDWAHISCISSVHDNTQSEVEDDSINFLETLTLQTEESTRNQVVDHVTLTDQIKEQGNNFYRENKLYEALRYYATASHVNPTGLSIYNISIVWFYLENIRILRWWQKLVDLSETLQIDKKILNKLTSRIERAQKKRS